MPAQMNSDLLELVVDALAGDKPTLAACALASSVLHRRARHHIFSDVTIFSLDRAKALVGLLKAEPALGEHVIRKLRVRDDAWLQCSQNRLIIGGRPIVAPWPSGNHRAWRL
jgi:hypothetical protein